MKTVQDLKSIQTQSILRINCPGFGQSALLSSDNALRLTEYKVIIVNPSSILHLFGGQTDILKQVDIGLSEGVTSFRLPDDQLINQISGQIEQRWQEFVEFLGQGGLLIYYLCRPFALMGSSRTLDSYAWLCGLVPDQSGESTIGENTVRHMSTVAHGRNIDKTPDASNSPFSKYFDQPGLEWNTIVRTDFLTDGYTVFALAGPKKCIAAQLYAGDNGGQVIFLPAPYSPDFDRTLIECINQWYLASSFAFQSATPETSAPETPAPQTAAPKSPMPQTAALQAAAAKSPMPQTAAPQAAPPKSPTAPAAAAAQAAAPKSPLQQVAAPKTAAPKSPPPQMLPLKPVLPKPPLQQVAAPKTAAPKSPPPQSASPQAGTAKPPLQQVATPKTAVPKSPPPQSASPQAAASQTGVLKSASAQATVSKTPPVPIAPSSQNITKKNVQAMAFENKQPTIVKKSEAKQEIKSDQDNTGNNQDLLNRLPKLNSLDAATTPQPSPQNANWSTSFYLPGMDNLNEETSAIRLRIKELQTQISINEQIVYFLDAVKVPLLTGGPTSLMESCKAVLDSLGWISEEWKTARNEFILNYGGKPAALAHVTMSKGEPERVEVGPISRINDSFLG